MAPVFLVETALLPEVLPYLAPPVVVLLLTALRLPELRLIEAEREEEPLLTAALRFTEVFLVETALRLEDAPLTFPTVGVLLYELPTSRLLFAFLGVTPLVEPML